MHNPYAYAVASIGAVASIIQSAPVAPDADLVDRVARLGTQGLLVVAVVILWRKVQEKDAVLMQNYKSMADALAANRVVVEKMSDTLDGIKESVEQLSTVRAVVRERNEHGD